MPPDTKPQHVGTEPSHRVALAECAIVRRSRKQGKVPPAPENHTVKTINTQKTVDLCAGGM